MNRFLAVASLFAVGLMLAPTLVAQSVVVNHLTMNQWVQLTEDGALTGRGHPWLRGLVSGAMTIGLDAADVEFSAQVDAHEVRALADERRGTLYSPPDAILPAITKQDDSSFHGAASRRSLRSPPA